MASFVFDDVSSGQGDGNMSNGQNWYVGGVQQFATPQVVDTATFQSVTQPLNGQCDANPSTVSGFSASSAIFTHDLNASGGTFTATTIGNDGNFSGSASYNGGTIAGNATFTTSTLNGGFVNGNATFTGSTFTSGGINGTCTFNSSTFNGGTISGALTCSNSTFNFDPGAGLCTSSGCTWLGSQSRTITGTNDVYGQNASGIGSYGGSAITNSGSGALVNGGTFVVSYTQTGGTISGGNFSLPLLATGTLLNSNSTTLNLNNGSTLSSCTITDANSNGSLSGNNWRDCIVSGGIMGSVNFQGTVDVTGGTYLVGMQFTNITTHINLSNFVATNLAGTLSMSVAFPTASVVEDASTRGIIGGRNVGNGNVQIPAAADVQLGVVYGVGGTQFTGSLASSAVTRGFGG